MKYIKLSDFIKINQEPFVCGAFLSRIMQESIDGKNYYYAYTSYKTSKFIPFTKFDFKKYASNELIEELNRASGYNNWTVHKVSDTRAELRYYLLIDIPGFTKQHLYDYIYKQSIMSDWALSDDLTDEKKNFIRGFSELRGSIDTTRPFLAQDYFYDSKKEIKKSQILTDTMNIPLHFCNFNSRELQPQYVSGANKRNSQFRINLLYYASTIGFINKYKSLIFEKAYNVKEKNIIGDIVYYSVAVSDSKGYDTKFINYLNFYTNNIYQKEITEQMLADLRKDLHFDEESSDKVRRNTEILKIYDRISPNVCAICGTTKTFVNKNKGHQDFETHHVLSMKNNKELDNIANLVKLCSTCHNMMKKGRGSEIDQINGIKKILTNHSEVYEFMSGTLGIDDIDELSVEVQKNLG